MCLVSRLATALCGIFITWNLHGTATPSKTGGHLDPKFGCATACASSTRAVFGGGWQPSPFNQLDYVQIMTTGNSTDFGDLTGNRNEAYGFSNGHGGL